MVVFFAAPSEKFPGRGGLGDGRTPGATKMVTPYDQRNRQKAKDAGLLWGAS
jgi:hypothetical protein